MPVGNESIHFLFLTRSLNYGGSQRQLVELLKGLAKRKVPAALATFYERGSMRAELEELAASVHCLNKRSRWDVIGSVISLCGLVRRLQPAVVHGYLGSANLLALVCKVVSPRTKVVWGIRASNMELHRYGWLDRVLYRLERTFAPCADLIIANSKAGRDYAVACGFPADRLVIIPNGIDVQRFHPDQDAGREFRALYGIDTTDLLIGSVGRLDPMKGHENFLRAAFLFEKKKQNVRFICVGEGPERYKKQLHRLSLDLGLEKNMIWLDAFHPIERFYNALDVMTSTSLYGEGFPNVIAEAMACGISCVATDVGDSKMIVGDTGRIVHPNDREGLVSAWLELTDAANAVKAERKQAARQRVERLFGLQQLIDTFLDTLEPFVTPGETT
ncbi:MAG TPA: glycosyltransferase [Nitrospira sp.]|nr:glycosyltransferase [Nitrospira sp.]